MTELQVIACVLLVPTLTFLARCGLEAWQKRRARQDEAEAAELEAIEQFFGPDMVNLATERHPR